MQTPEVSFEFFPPRSIEAAFRLRDTVQELAPFAPRFVSVTYGAGGSTREITHDAVKAIRRTSSVPVAAHITCVETSRTQMRQILKNYAQHGINELVVLRGDLPKENNVQSKNGYKSVCDLIEDARKIAKFKIRVAAYPNPHPESLGPKEDIRWLKAKFEAGAEEAITQFFFEPEDFLRFRDRCAKAGLSQQITPGILPIENWSGAIRFAKRCGITVPVWMAEAFEKAKRDGRSELLATALCAELCDKLCHEGVDRLHFYTLNQAYLSRNVCLALGLNPQQTIRKVA